MKTEAKDKVPFHAIGQARDSVPVTARQTDGSGGLRSETTVI